MKKISAIICVVLMCTTAALFAQTVELIEPINVLPQSPKSNFYYSGCVGEYQLLCFYSGENRVYALFKPNEELIYAKHPAELSAISKAKKVRFLFCEDNQLYFAMLVKSTVWIVQYDAHFNYLAHIETGLKKDDDILRPTIKVLKTIKKDNRINFIYSSRFDYTWDGQYAGSYYYVYSANLQMNVGYLSSKRIYTLKENHRDATIPIHFSPSCEYMTLFDSQLHTYTNKEKPSGTKIRFEQDKYHERILMRRSCQLRILNYKGEELRRWEDSTDYYMLDNIRHFDYSCIGVTDDGTAIVLSDSMQVINTFREHKNIFTDSIRHEFSSPNILGIYCIPIAGEARFDRIENTKLVHIAHHMDCIDQIISTQDTIRISYSPYDITVSYLLSQKKSNEMYLDIKNKQIVSLKNIPKAQHEIESTLYEDRLNKKSYSIGYDRSEDCYYLMVYNRDTYTYEEIPICKNLNRYSNNHKGFYMTPEKKLFRIQDKHILYYPLNKFAL